MLRTLLFTCGSALVITAGVLVASLAVKKRFDVKLSVFGFGALCFIAAQTVHIPLLLGLTALFKLAPPASASTKLVINTLVLGSTAGLCEELSRYVFMKQPQVGVKRWGDALGFGLGHGGVEALLVALSAPINAGYLLWKGDAVLDQVRAKSPEAVDKVAKQLEALRHFEPTLALFPVWERALAVLLHVALTLVVWQAVRSGRRWLVAVAVLWHAALDGAVVVAASKGLDALQVELAFTAASTLSALVIWLSWRANRESARPALA